MEMIRVRNVCKGSYWIKSVSPPSLRRSQRYSLGFEPVGGV